MTFAPPSAGVGGEMLTTGEQNTENKNQ